MHERMRDLLGELREELARKSRESEGRLRMLAAEFVRERERGLQGVRDILAARNEKLRSSLEQEQARLAAALQGLQDADSDLKAERERMESAALEALHLEEEIAAKERDLRKQVDERAALARETEARIAEKEKLEVEARRLEARIARSEQTGRRLEKLSAEIDRQKERLERTERELSRTRAEVKERQERLGLLPQVDVEELVRREAELKRALAEAERVEAELADRKRALAAAEKAVEEATPRCAEARARKEDLERRIAQAQAQAELVRGPLGGLQERLRQLELRRRRAREELGSLEAENRVKEDELSGLRDAILRLEADIVRERDMALETESAVQDIYQASTRRREERQALSREIRRLKDDDIPLTQQRVEALRQSARMNQALKARLDKEAAQERPAVLALQEELHKLKSALARLKGEET